MRLSLKEGSPLLALLAALLSSSCCVIQLILNVFSISCAGFSIFTPYRTLLATITVVLLSYNLYRSYNKNQMIVSIVVCVALMASPEIVKYVNRQGRKGIYNSAIHLDGLGCEACANRIKTTLIAVEWIADVRVYFDNRTAIVSSNEMMVAERVVQLIKSIDTKYDAQVLCSWTE